ncbi:unnamed protein product [Lathyrus sativus]|nr:unnamed protein product [Lathyrus sativus]
MNKLKSLEDDYEKQLQEEAKELEQLVSRKNTNSAKEEEYARLDRLKYVLKARLFEVDSDMTEGQTYDFLHDIADLRKRQKPGIGSDRKRQKAEDDLSDCGGSSGADNDKDLKRMKANFENLCDENKILVFFKKLLNEWK